MAEIFEKSASFENTTERAGQERTQTHGKVRATKRETHRGTTQATTENEKQKTNDGKTQSTTTAAPLSIVAAPVYFD